MSSPPQELCDLVTLERFLTDQLSEHEQRQLESHLDCCPNCCEDLQRLAAERQLWHEVRLNLSSDSFLHPVNTGDTGSPSSTPVRDLLQLDQEQSLSKLVLSFLGPTDDPRMLGRLGSYEIAGIVGYGGMGIVLKAYDPSLNRYAALKVLAPHLATSGAARRRFQREAQAAAAVVHENVVEIFGVSEMGGMPYLAMPYVRGISLERRIRDQGPLRIEEILRIGMQTAAGLAAAHAQGLIHRDVKPANILLADGVERVKLTDFGLARAIDDASLTKSGVISGTPQYMSPEQARGEALDCRSDLFGLASVMYAMCTGRPPFRAETSYGILRRVTDNDPRPIREINPAIPEWLELIIVKLHSKRPEDRFPSAEQLSRLLEDCLAHVQQPTRVPLPVEAQALISDAATRRRRWPMQRWMIPAAGAGLLALVTLGMIVPPARVKHADSDSSTHSAAQQVPESKPFPKTDPSPTGVNVSSDWDDGTLEQLHALERDTISLEHVNSHFWSTQAAEAPRLTNAPLISSDAPPTLTDESSSQESSR